MSDNSNQSFVTSLVADLPPMAKTILMWFLLFPLAIAMSGFILQIGAGEIVRAYLFDNPDKAQTSSITIESLLTDQMQGLSGQLSAMQVEQSRQNGELRASVQGVIRELAAFTARVDGLEKRLEGVVRDVGRLKFAFCDTDKLPLEACVLKD